MKKPLIILVVLLCLCSCTRSYKCVLTYSITYPDTTWTHTYMFDGTWEAKVNIYNSSKGKKVLYVYPYGDINIGCREIAAVPKGNADITILDFKIYRYGIDIPKNEK